MRAFWSIIAVLLLALPSASAWQGSYRAYTGEVTESFPEIEGNPTKVKTSLTIGRSDQIQGVTVVQYDTRGKVTIKYGDIISAERIGPAYQYVVSAKITTQSGKNKYTYDED